MNRWSLVLTLGFAFLAPSAATGQAWLRILQKGVTSDYSQQRHDALKQVKTSSKKGLRVLWNVLESQAKEGRCASIGMCERGPAGVKVVAARMNFIRSD